MSAASDAAELERCMAVCLSAAKIGALAAPVGFPIAAAGSAAQAAHQVVKGMDRSGRLPELRAALRQARPLVEWPEPGPSPADEEAVELSGEALVDDFAPGAPPFDALPVSVPPSSRGGPASFAADPGPPARAWQPLAPENRPRALDARILIAVAGLMVVAAAIAFAAGRVSTGEATTTAPTASVTSSGAPRRPDGPAVRAADAVGRSLSNVSRACELRGIEPGGVLVAALAECGPGGVARRPRRPPVDGEASAPAPAETAAVHAATPRAAAPGPAGNPGGPCITGCDGRHGECRAGCGPEPQHATEYAPHQQCLARCLAAASKCRLGCE
ncbi:MAG: hypothetical protein WKG00_11225 [Polyangiaceae bacterium]